MLPASLRGLVFSSSYLLESRNSSFATTDPDFHLQPSYRAQMPLDAIVLKTQASLDRFITEKHHDRIAAILAQWSTSLQHSPQDVEVFARVFAPDFEGSTLRPSEFQLARSAAAPEVSHHPVSSESGLGPEAFLTELRATMGAFSKIAIAEFQVVNIEASSELHFSPERPGKLKTRIRYEVVGTGHNLYRLQRVGEWDLEWSSSSSSPIEFRLRRWQALAGTESRSTSPFYVDIAKQALGGAASYSSQLLRGTDYWRTVLDGACGIDIYGNNGISAGDIDGDGFDDLYICQPSGLPNRLFRNRGDGTFEDITEASGVGILDNTSCALFADFDNDGRQDLIVVCTDGPLLFQNEGGGSFRRKPSAFRFATPPQGTFTGAAVADYDRDGWLDVYFCLYLYYRGTDQYNYPSPYYDAENGPPNFLMRNNRDATFSDVTSATGLNQNNTRYSFCCGWGDFNGDGWPDLYVVNDFGRKNLYRNNGNGTFTDVALETKVEDVGAGMSVCCFDYDNDGAEDLYVGNMWTAAGNRIATQETFQRDAPERARALFRKHAMGNSLFQNSSHGIFRDTTGAAGVGMGRWSWSSDTWDFDHDGFPDLYVTNGMISGPSRLTQADDLNSFFWRQVVAHSPVEASVSHDYELGWNALNELIRSDHTWSGFERNMFYANNRDGTFSDVSGVVGLDFVEDGRAFALADFNHDGRQEVFLKNRNGPQLRVLQNVRKDLPPSVAFRLRGTKSNRDAIGTAVTLECGSRKQTRRLQAGSGFLSQHSKEVFFGLGDAKGEIRASVRWPSGLVQDFRDLPTNHRIEIEEGSKDARFEAFDIQASKVGEGVVPESQESETLPATVETWLLAPISAPDCPVLDLSGQTRAVAALRGKPVFLNFWATASANCLEDLKVLNRFHKRWLELGLQVLAVNVDEPRNVGKLQAFSREHQLSFPVGQGSDDVAAIYNILYRSLFDRHRDMSLPTSFLLNDKGDIVKIYQGRFNPEHVEYDSRQIPQTARERLMTALPFAGVTDTLEFRRNYLSFGAVYFQREYFDQAEASFRRALDDDPASAEALYGLGSVYLKQQKPEEARQIFEHATQAKASYPDTLPNAWNNLGLLAARQGDTSDAIQYFQQALRKNPDHLIVLNNLGNAYRQQKQWGEARKVLERAVHVSPQDPEANYSLGMVLAQLDDTEGAYEYLRKALQFRPGYPEALNNLGVLYLRTQRRDEAVASFEECMRVAPAFDQAYLNRARVYVLENQPEKARTLLMELLKQHPDHAPARRMLEQLPR
jgi:tetratricopeptide (TPR) repeat protein/peroxiredoxin